MPEPSKKKRFSLLSLVKKSKKEVTRLDNADEFLKQYEKAFASEFAYIVGADKAEEQTCELLLKAWHSAAQEGTKRKSGFFYSFGGIGLGAGYMTFLYGPSLLEKSTGLGLMALGGFLVRQELKKEPAAVPTSLEDYISAPNANGSKSTYKLAERNLSQMCKTLGLRDITCSPVPA